VNTSIFHEEREFDSPSNVLVPDDCESVQLVTTRQQGQLRHLGYIGLLPAVDL